MSRGTGTDVGKAVRAALADLDPVPTGTERHALGAPHRMLRLRHPEPTSGDAGGSFERCGSRVLVERQGASPAMVDLADDGDDGPRFSSFARNAISEAYAAALRLAADGRPDEVPDVLTLASRGTATLVLAGDPPTFVPFLDGGSPVAAPRFEADFLARALR